MLSLVCLSISWTWGSASGSAAMRWLYFANATGDFDKAKTAGDFRFVGLYGFTGYVPGLDEQCVADEQVRYIEGSSDYRTSLEHNFLMKRGEQYAMRFNSLMFSHLRETANFRCP